MFANPFIYAGLASLIMGVSKAGLKGLGVIVVILMAMAFEAKASTGILLPLLISADLLAIYSYRKDVVWSTVWLMVPWIAIGVIAAVIVGDYISDVTFKKAMAVIVIIGACLMLLSDRLKWSELSVPRPVSYGIGLLVGFTTMLGNLAGPFANLYFIAGRFPKDHFIATAAWMFFLINLFKLPFHIFVWKTINWSTLTYDIYMLPFVFIGFFIGFRIVKLFTNDSFKYYVIGMTILGAIIMLIR